jgi:hypothetical protein
LPGRNANANTDPHAFTYRNSDSDGNSYTDRDRNGDGYNHTTCNSYACADTLGDSASANAKAAANAVPSSDAVSE